MWAGLLDMGRRHCALNNMKPSKIPTVVITFTVALSILGTMGVLSFKFSTANSNDQYINLAILLTGMAVGWLLGTAMSPDSEAEESRFSRYGTAIKAFASGYLVSKCDKLITASLDPEYLLKDLPLFRFLL